jgi:hypothetical protein
MNKLLNIFLATVVVALTACGGGGGSAGTSPFGNGGSVAGCVGAAASAASGSGGASCATASTLTLQLDSASIQNTGAASVKATATATTAAGQALSGIPITFSVDNGATFTQSSSSTAADGTVVATIGIGADPSNRVITVTATTGSLTASRVFAVTGASLAGTRVPAIVAPGSASNRVDFRLTDANGKGIVGAPISVTAGSLGTSTGVTGSNGDYSYVYTAPTTTGNLDIVAVAGGVTNTQSVSVQSSATAIGPASGVIQSASVSANPSVVSTNTSTTSNRTEIRALFVGNSNVPIERVRVRFDALDVDDNPSPLGGTFSTGDNIVYSDSSGIATSAYIPGTRSSPTNGVKIRACYSGSDFALGACPNATFTTITVVADALSVTIGSNDKIGIGPQDLTYTRQFVILVVDASGKAKANVDIVPSIDLDRYWKGFFSRPTGATEWAQSANSGGCANEDINRNGVLESVEDINHSAAIEPRKSDVAVRILGTGKTDDSGAATVQIEYPQNVATWVRVKILVSATGVSGTEGRATWTEVLGAPGSAFTQTTPPPFVSSPYGIVYFAENPLSPPPNFDAHSTFPDGTAVPNATINDPCKNPF